MDKALVERLAKEAELDWLTAMVGPDGKDRVMMYAVTPEQLAKLVTLAAEECAKEVERMVMYPGGRQESAAHNTVWDAATAIRSKFQMGLETITFDNPSYAEWLRNNPQT